MSEESRFTNLPNELKQAIMMCVRDPQDLRRLNQSCKGVMPLYVAAVKTALNELMRSLASMFTITGDATVVVRLLGDPMYFGHLTQPQDLHNQAEPIYLAFKIERNNIVRIMDDHHSATPETMIRTFIQRKRDAEFFMDVLDVFFEIEGSSSSGVKVGDIELVNDAPYVPVPNIAHLNRNARGINYVMHTRQDAKRALEQFADLFKTNLKVFLRNAAAGAGGASKSFLILKGRKKPSLVRKEKSGKYIILDKKKVYLKDIRGKYRYVTV